MKLLTGVLVAALLFTDLDKIGKINTLKSEAKKAYLGGDYKTAVEKYKYLVDSLGVKEDEVLLNLANSYFELQDTTNISNAYLPLTQSNNSKIKSVASQQLGVAANRQGKFEEALNHFKQALKADPANEDARFNYEIVKKKVEDQKKKEEEQNKDNKKEDEKKEDDKKEDKKDQKDKDNKDKKQDQKDKQDKEQKDKEKKEQQEKEQKEKQSKEQQEKEKKEKEQKQKEQDQKDQKDKDKDKKDIPPSVSDKLKDMHMSEEKAKMILEAMKNQEVQYLQQNKRKATKPKDKGKPDW